MDENGNTLRSNMLTDEDKDWLLTAMWARYGPVNYIQEKYGDVFSEKEIEWMGKVLESRDMLFVNDKTIDELHLLIRNNPLEKLDYAIKMSIPSRFNEMIFFDCHPTSPYFSKRFTFDEALLFIEERSGIYYAIDNEGNRRFDFIDKPTKKQAQYQRNKNGNMIAFLSFTDWKEYRVQESELL